MGCGVVASPDALGSLPRLVCRLGFSALVLGDSRRRCREAAGTPATSTAVVANTVDEVAEASSLGEKAGTVAPFYGGKAARLQLDLLAVHVSSRAGGDCSLARFLLDLCLITVLTPSTNRL